MVQPCGGRGGKHPEHERPRRDPPVLPYRRRRKPHQFLADIIDAALGDRAFEPGAVRCRQFAGQHRAMAGKARNRTAVGAFDGKIVEPVQHFLARGFLAAPPGRDVRHLEVLAQKALAQAWQEAEQRPRLQHAGTRHVGDHDAVLAQHVDQARHAEMRGGIKFQRIEKVGIDPAQQHIEPLQPGDGADMDAVAADGEIVALDQQEAEITRDRGMFEISFAEGARRQQSDPRIIAVGAAAQRIAKRLEERRHPFDVHRLVEVGKGPRQHQAVFQRVAGARRRLRAVAQHPPAPVRATADVGGIEMQITPARRFDAAHRAQIFVAAGDRGRGYRAFGDQTTLAIQIAEDNLQQLRALRDAGAQLLPVGLIDDQRQVAQRP